MTDLEKQIAGALHKQIIAVQTTEPPSVDDADGNCRVCGETVRNEIMPLVRTFIEASEEARYREGYSDGQRGNTFPEKPVAGAALSRVIEAETKVLREAVQAANVVLLQQKKYSASDQEALDILQNALTANSSEPILRCQARHPEGGQCELRQGHDFDKHLAGMILWPKP